MLVGHLLICISCLVKSPNDLGSVCLYVSVIDVRLGLLVCTSVIYESSNKHMNWLQWLSHEIPTNGFSQGCRSDKNESYKFQEYIVELSKPIFRQQHNLNLLLRLL